MIIKNKWKASNEDEIEKNDSLIELSNLWSSQITVTTTKLSIIKEGPVNVKYKIISK